MPRRCELGDVKVQAQVHEVAHQEAPQGLCQLLRKAGQLGQDVGEEEVARFILGVGHGLLEALLEGHGACHSRPGQGRSSQRFKLGQGTSLLPCSELDRAGVHNRQLPNS